MLLQWYKTERPREEGRHETAFEEARMKSGESLSIYAMRLQQLAKRAFPQSSKQQEKQLCKKYSRTVPQFFLKVLNNAEQNLLVMGRKGRLTWENISRLAESEDRKRKKRSEAEVEDYQVWYNRPNASPVSPRSYKPQVSTKSVSGSSKPDNKKTYGLSPPRVFTNRNGTHASARGGMSNRTTLCHWCGRVGHRETNCWVKLGACLICGSSEHERETCPRFHSGRNSFAPECSVCGEGHLGKDCMKTLNC